MSQSRWTDSPFPDRPVDLQPVASAVAGADPGARRVRRRPTLAYSRAYSNDPRVLAPDNSGGLARLWRWTALAILLPVLVVTVIRAFHQLPFAVFASEQMAGLLGHELDVPTDMLHAAVTLHSTPPAEVWIDGRNVGETPIERLSIALGPHEIRFHHPAYRDRIHEIVATRSQPVQITVDFTEP